MQKLLGVVEHTFNPGTLKVEAGRSWSPGQVPGQPGLCTETLSQKQTSKQMNSYPEVVQRPVGVNRA